MRTFAATIKIFSFLVAMTVGITAIILELQAVSIFAMVAMLLLFTCQAAEIFLGGVK